MSAPFTYEVVDAGDRDLAHETEVLGRLADRVRALSKASMMTTVPLAEAEDITLEIEALIARLEASRRDTPHGIQVTTDGKVYAHGNAVMGLRNPIAPPVHIERSGTGHVWTSFHLNALYEGPPSSVHGGVAALVLDQLLGECASDSGKPGMTGTLTLKYLRPTPLGDCSGEAWVTEIDSTKTHVRGVLRDARGNDTVEATGVFILPKWARDQMAAANGASND